jgi:hypothetical protein
MRRWLLVALTLGALLVPAIPASAAPSASGVLAWRRSHRFWHRPWVWRRPYVGFGWGYYPGYPYYGYGPYPGYGYGYSPISREWAVVDTDVSPEDAEVYLDGKFIGLADDFDGYPDYLYLKRGRYRLEFRLEGFEPRTIEVEARPGRKLDIGDKLRKIPGARQYGTYEPRRPEGDVVHRFWAKRRDTAESVTDEEEIYGVPSPGRTERRPEPDEESDRTVEPEDETERAPEREERDRPREAWRDGGSARPPAARERTDRGYLALTIEPSDAAVYLDDRFIGTGEEVEALERGVSVSAGRHTVTVSRPGFEDRQVEVEVDQGETERLEITLKR